MSPGGVIEAAIERRKTLVHYAPDPGDLSERFVARNVDVTFRELPPGGPGPFVTVREDDDFQGAVSVESLEVLLAPPHASAFDHDDVSPTYGALLELLDDTVFASLSRRQLLATTREFEDRAWRAGDGLLHVGFQTTEALEPQRALYRRLAAETDLDVHVHFTGDSVDLDDITVHEDSECAADYWFVAFDGPDDSQCALVAEQRDENDYEGAWTYDPDLVAGVLEDVTAGA
ncbi:DICT sensory domain-containing protein [Halobacterium jilantaiense]|uniref:Diguanylate Cyclase and Two-component system sensory domain-containing protein n=1 Tax=Halobacterium jilantaiense TaxID=355548 RepID=A0A1I0PWA1_9EURY|nr:DICT sensory domain-containing protein [Halobacterium jilantaiense]SEW18562.1 Diguanylate Cyclase and Two-component system sensory domain-containing protein [Halobacterium jilantaiense]